MNILRYKVGGHLFQLSTPYALSLDNYKPFLQEFCDDAPLFHVLITNELAEKETTLIKQFDDDVASITAFSLNGGGYRFHISHPMGEECAIMDIDHAFSNISVILKGDIFGKNYGLNNCMMITYALATAAHNTVLVHASVVSHKDQAFLFLGKSGTGKSTHSRLWLEHIKGCELLNDDNPAIRVFPDKNIIVYGTPWSGKTTCYLNKQFPVGAIVRLRQAPMNKIVSNGHAQAFALLISSCSTLSWDNYIYESICNTITGIVEAINCYTLDCLPDKAAAELCRQAVTKITK